MNVALTSAVRATSYPWSVALDLMPHLLPGFVLDVGTGTGLVAAGLRELGRAVVGLDASAAMLAKARERLGSGVVLADAQAMPIASGCVPNLVYVHVLHVVADMAVALAEAARVARAPGGRLIAIHGVPTAQPDDMIDAIRPLQPLMDAVADTAPNLDPMVEAAGFRLVSREWASPFDGGMSPNAYAKSITGRVWSYLANVDELTWSRLVEPVIAALRGLPGPDEPRQQSWRVQLAVFERS